MNENEKCCEALMRLGKASEWLVVCVDRWRERESARARACESGTLVRLVVYLKC